jgi:hypothetical protein
MMPESSQSPPAEPPLPAASAALTDEGDVQAPQVEFWRRWWTQHVLPWVTSLVIHAALIILLLATYQAAGKFFRVVQEQIVIPDASLAPDAGGIPNPGLNDERNRDAAQNTDSNISEPNGFAQASRHLTDALVNDSSSHTDESPALPGLSGERGLSNAPTGALAQFGNPGGGQSGPHGRLFGHGGNAMKIVYICDASGSMLSKIELMKLELQKSVEQLQPVQAFDVFFFHDAQADNQTYVCLAPDLMMATANNKKKLYSFLGDVTPQGYTHVIPALTAAFDLPTRPDLVYLLTDGAFEEETGPVVVQAIERLNANKRVKINPVLLIDPRDISDDELKEASDAMRTIATENGGVYNQVTVNELDN